MRNRILHMVAIMLMLAACAGPGERERQGSLARQSHTHDHDDYDRHAAYHHDEPSPDEIYAGQIALLLSAQIFTCAFFVIILDGSCHGYIGIGLPY